MTVSITGMHKTSRLAGILVAAGNSTRFGGDKLFFKLLGRPLICTTLEAFCRLPIHTLVVVCRLQDQKRLLACMARSTVPDRIQVLLAAGGATRAESVRNGVEALLAAEVATGQDYVLVHDGARPILPERLLQRLLAPAETLQDVTAPAVLLVDSLRRRTGETTECVDRHGMMAVQTPQLCRIGALQRAYDVLPDIGRYGDETALVEAAGGTIGFTEGDTRNIKVTVPQDAILVEAILRSGMQVITGFGYDIHRFVTGRPLLLGGVGIPSDEGLEGTSDADAVLHALMDAILGCAGAGDIGAMFPSSDPQYEGIDSTLLLRRVLAEKQVQDLRLCSVDITIVAEKPRLAPYQPVIQKRLAFLLRLPASHVNIKVTGNDAIGWIGHGEGIAALCVVNALRKR